MARIDHLTGGIYRISTYAPEKRLRDGLEDAALYVRWPASSSRGVSTRPKLHSVGHFRAWHV